MTQDSPDREVFAGIDTHADTHHAAVIDTLGRHLADRSSQQHDPFVTVVLSERSN